MSARIQTINALFIVMILAGAAMAEETISDKIDRANKVINDGDEKKGTALLREVVAELERAAADRPDDYETRLQLGRAHFCLAEDEEALADLKLAARIDPKAYAPHWFCGIIHRDREELEVAVEAFTTACRLASKNSECWYELADTLRRKKDFQEALFAFRRAHKLSPDDGRIICATGTLLSQLDRHKEALEMYLKAHALAPDEADIIYNAGQSAQNVGLHKQALGHFLTAARLASDDWKAIVKTIQEYEALGMEEERDRARERLYALRKKGAVASLNKANLFIREQFEHKDKKIFVLEYFEMKGDMAKKLSFNVTDRKSGASLYKVTLGSYDFTNLLAQASGEVSKGNRLWHLDRYDKNDAHTTISFFDGEPPYDVVRSLVVEVLEGRLTGLSSSRPR